MSKGTGMEYIGKKQKRLALVTGIVYVSMIIVCIAGLYLRGVNNMVPIYVFNVAMEIISMCTG